MKREIFQISRAWNHVPVIIIFEFIHTVYIDLRNPAVTEQPFLVMHPMPPEQGDGLVRIDGPLIDGHIHFYHLPHSRFYLVQKLLIYGYIPFHRTVIPLAHGKMNPYFPDLIMPGHIIHRFHQHKLDTAPVRPISDLSGRRLKRKCTV